MGRFGQGGKGGDHDGLFQDDPLLPSASGPAGQSNVRSPQDAAIMKQMTKSMNSSRQRIKDRQSHQTSMDEQQRKQTEVIIPPGRGNTQNMSRSKDKRRSNHEDSRQIKQF